MNILDSLIKAKEDHIIERYCEDCEPCLDCTETHNTREVKKMYVDEILHHHEHLVHEHAQAPTKK